MRPDRVEDHRALAHQQIAGPVQDQDALLLFALDRHEAHVRPRHRFADRFGISRIVLLPFDVWLDIGRRDQPYLVAEGRDLAGPVMRRRAGFHPDQARLQLAEEIQNCAASQLLLQQNRTIGVNAMKLKDGLGEIDPECCNLHVDGSFPLLVCDSTRLAHRDAVGVEPSTPSGELGLRRCRALASLWR